MPILRRVDSGEASDPQGVERSEPNVDFSEECGYTNQRVRRVIPWTLVIQF
jgi:hypothetical protein